MLKIEHWLGELNLSRYGQNFKNNEIEFSDLGLLTDSDLKEIGLPVGPRRRLLAAIAEIESTDEHRGGLHFNKRLASSYADQNSAERRHLTVMFVDLVGSTQMAEGTDPEDMRNVLTSYHQCVSELIYQHDGFVAKYMGDGVLCYFGWPVAQENDAERAVRSGLAIISEVRQLNGPDTKSLSTRIGLASGIVVVGDIIGTGASQEAAIVGESPNMAARLQGLAAPNKLVISDDTRRLLGNLFELHSLGEHSLKGISKPVLAFSVITEKDHVNRFAVRQSECLPSIIGREIELERLQSCWQLAKLGKSRSVLVTGEAGVGKSRVIRALTDEIAGDDYYLAHCQCSPHHTTSALYPIIAYLSKTADIQATDSDNEKLNKLEGISGVTGDCIDVLASMLGVNVSNSNFPPSRQREVSLQILCKVMVSQSKLKPMLFIFEDLHWIDPTSLEWINRFMDAMLHESICLVLTARTDIQIEFVTHSELLHLPLRRLDAKSTLSLVEHLTHDSRLPEEALQLIATRTDGVPLFVEELVKSILECSVFDNTSTKRLMVDPVTTLSIPDTLHGSLMARLDRLGDARFTAQVAACIGREFDCHLLYDISDTSIREVDEALDELVRSGLIFVQKNSPALRYYFKHALVRDAAYSSLLKKTRRITHRKIVETLQRNCSDSHAVIGWHAQAANMFDCAADSWEQASKIDMSRAAYDEAIVHLQSAIDITVSKLGQDSPVSYERALKLQIQLGTALAMRKGYGADDTCKAFERALQLSDMVGDTPLRHTVLHGLWGVKYLRAEHDDALMQAESILELADRGDDISAQQVANRTVGMTLTFQGRFLKAQPHFLRAHSLLERLSAEERSRLKLRFQDPGVGVNCYLALNYWFLGKTQKARKHAEIAEYSALGSEHTNTICYMHNHLMLAAYLADNIPAATMHTDSLNTIATDHRMDLWCDLAGVSRALLLAAAGKPAGIEQFMRADTHFTASNTQIFMSYYRIRAGELALEMGLREIAIQLNDMARTLIENTGEAFALSYSHRLEGLIAIAEGDCEFAERCFEESIEIACMQSSPSWQIKSVVALSKLWIGMGLYDKAVNFLESVDICVESGDCVEDKAVIKSLLSSCLSRNDVGNKR